MATKRERIQITLTFKPNPEEKALYDFVKSQYDQSAFLKNLIREYIQSNHNSILAVMPSQPVSQETLISKEIPELNVNVKEKEAEEIPATKSISTKSRLNAKSFLSDQLGDLDE
ncbi:MAG: hypothetical protein ATN35_02120 [Epulopiscium sp. Nele67-Bin004]|nr:MAG: hypothetical protein ATN35_02120 [Epulopiscium sp. Nele67-Bin004]